MSAQVRTFDSGATRNLDAGKLDFEGFLSPLVLRRYAEYMHKHRVQADGTLRDSDNWQRGIPLVAYMKSGHRHFFDWWSEHRGYSTDEGIEEALCALIFNAMGYLHEHLRASGCKCTKLSCPGSWEPGCGLGFDVAYAVPAREEHMAALNASVRAVSGRMPPFDVDDDDLGLKAGEAAP